MSDRPVRSIEEISERVAMGPFGSSIKVETFVPEGVPVISGQHLHGSRVDDSVAFNYISDEHAERLRNANVEPGDVILTHAGSIGQVAMVRRNAQFERYVISQRQFTIRCDQTQMLPEFLVAYFKTPEGRHLLLANASQTGVPSLARPVSYIRTVKVPVPPIRVQSRIVNILGALDDKIELNRRMNETHEALSQAVFDAWVLDAYSVATEAAETDKWEQVSLDRIADFLNGAACQKYPVAEDGASLPVVKIRELNQGVTPQSDRVTTAIPEKWHVRDGDVLFSWSGTLLAKLWTGGDAALNQHLFKVTSAEYPKWFYFRWVLHHLDAFRGVAADRATTMGHIKRHHLTDAVCLVPPPSILEHLDDLMAPLLERQFACDMESRTLIELRDTLLPKLISGDLRIADAERLVSEVT